MRVRPLLILTGIVSAILGAIVVYLILSVPNDLRADSLLKQARQELADGKNDDARTSLMKIVEQYPRTDAAAAATVGLVKLGYQERQQLQRTLADLQRKDAAQTQALADLQKGLTDVRNAPPKVVTVQAPPPPAPKPAAKKTTPKKKTPPKKRRR
jgi:hypothetical protein